MPELTAEEKELVAKAIDYEQLLETRAWKHLFSFFEKRALAALEKLEACASSDGMVIVGMVRNWQEREAAFRELQEEISGTIAERKNMILEIMHSQGATKNEVDEILEREKILNLGG